MTNRQRFRPWLHIPLTLLLGGCGVVYYGYIDRPTISPAQDGWKLKFSYARWACRTCRGKIELLECQDQTISPPVLEPDEEGNSKRLLIETPVGTFETFTGFNQWRFIHDRWLPEESDDLITAAELKRGCYNHQLPDDSGEWQVPSRKKGTPGHWCRASSNSSSFWIDPALLGELAAYDQPASDGTKAAETPTPTATQPSTNAP